MNLSNYSAETAVDEAVTLRKSVPELLRHAAALAGVDWVLQRLVLNHGLSNSVARAVLRAAGCLAPPPTRLPAPSVERIVRVLRREWGNLSSEEQAVVFDQIAKLHHQEREIHA